MPKSTWSARSQAFSRPQCALGGILSRRSAFRAFRKTCAPKITNETHSVTIRDGRRGRFWDLPHAGSDKHLGEGSIAIEGIRPAAPQVTCVPSTYAYHWKKRRCRVGVSLSNSERPLPSRIFRRVMFTTTFIVCISADAVGFVINSCLSSGISSPIDAHRRRIRIVFLNAASKFPTKALCLSNLI